jgi:hypothetical protein
MDIRPHPVNGGKWVIGYGFRELGKDAITGSLATTKNTRNEPRVRWAGDNWITYANRDLMTFNTQEDAQNYIDENYETLRAAAASL